MKNIVFLLSLAFAFTATGQDKPETVYQTFKDTRVINAHSIETLKAGHLDFRIGHRFGDIAGDAGGWETFYGLENASDVMIGFDYGLTDRWMIGLNRTKGNGPLRQNVHLYSKIKLAEQTIEKGLPFSVAVLGMGSFSTMPGSNSPGVLNFFERFEHRVTYHGEVLIARKFGQWLSLQLSGAWTYRNLVPADDQNDLVSFGFCGKLQLNKAFGIIVDGRYVFSDFRTSDNDYYFPLGIGLEWETGGGHVFQINLTNATGIAQTDYIPYTNSNWLDGEFRLGFTISRLFRI